MRTRIGPAFTLLSLAFASAACNRPRTSAMARDTSMARDTAAAAAPRVDKNAEEQAIKDIGRKWEKMFADRDTSGIAALFADDGYEMPPNTKAMKGPEEIRKGTGAMVRTTKDLKLTFEPSTITVSDAGDLAAERGTYKLSFTGSRGKKIEDHGNYVTVWKKVDGQWKVLSDINSSEVPGAM
ncbi:MAG: YybH family protein [Gemmatimonadales bacterium]